MKVDPSDYTCSFYGICCMGSNESKTQNYHHGMTVMIQCNALPLHTIFISRIFLILPPVGFLVTSDHDGPDWHEGGGVGAAGADQAVLGAAAAGPHQDTQEEE